MPGKVCSAYGCNNSDSDKRLKGKISFHAFPFTWGEEHVKAWTIRLRRENFTPTRHMVVCSAHFEESCFQYQNFTGRRQLKRGSEPTIFSHNYLNVKKAKKVQNASHKIKKTAFSKWQKEAVLGSGARHVIKTTAPNYAATTLEPHEVQMQLNLSCITIDPGQDEASVNHLAVSSKPAQTKRTRKKLKQVQDKTGENHEASATRVKGSKPADTKFMQFAAETNPACSSHSIEACPSTSSVHPVKLFYKRSVETSQSHSVSPAKRSRTDFVKEDSADDGQVGVIKSKKMGHKDEFTKFKGREIVSDATNSKSFQIGAKESSSIAAINLSFKDRCELPDSCQLQNQVTTLTDIPSKQHTCCMCGEVFEWEHQLVEHQLLHGAEQEPAALVNSRLMCSPEQNPLSSEEAERQFPKTEKTNSKGLDDSLSHETEQNSLSETRYRFPQRTAKGLTSSNQRLSTLPNLGTGSDGVLNNFNPVVCNKTDINNHTASSSTKQGELVKDLTCRFCGKVFKLPSHLHMHIMNIHKDHTNLDLLKDNLQFGCSLCKRPFTSLERLVAHFAKHRAGASCKAQTVKVHRCRFCGKDCKSPFELRRHVMRVHKDHSSLDVVKDNLQFVCTVCKKSFTSLQWLQAHLERHKSGRLDKTCDICGKVFLNKFMLREHRLSHSDERKYMCKECGKTYKYCMSLAKHEQVHHAQKKHLCEICGKELASRDGLKGHMRAHEGPPAYKCDVCGKGYYLPWNLKQHMASKHNITEPVGQPCPKN